MEFFFGRVIEPQRFCFYFDAMRYALCAMRIIWHGFGFAKRTDYTVLGVYF